MEKKAKQFFDRGLQHLASYQCESSRYWFVRSFTLRDEPRSHHWIGLTSMICGSYDDALDTFTTILEEDESNYKIRLLHALLLIHLEKTDEGISHLVRCIYEVAQKVDDIDEFFTHFVQKYLILTNGIVDLTLNCNKSYIVSASGATDFIIKGRSTNSMIFSRGYGVMDCRDLFSEYTKITYEGTNKCFVYVTKELTAEINYIGDVYYLGNPEKVISTITSSGKLINLGN